MPAAGVRTPLFKNMGITLFLLFSSFSFARYNDKYSAKIDLNSQDGVLGNKNIWAVHAVYNYKYNRCYLNVRIYFNVAFNKKIQIR